MSPGWPRQAINPGPPTRGRLARSRTTQDLSSSSTRHARRRGDIVAPAAFHPGKRGLILRARQTAGRRSHDSTHIALTSGHGADVGSKGKATLVRENDGADKWGPEIGRPERSATVNRPFSYRLSDLSLPSAHRTTAVLPLRDRPVVSRASAPESPSGHSGSASGTYSFRGRSGLRPVGASACGSKWREPAIWLPAAD